MNTAEKALNACREYDCLMTAISRNKEDIGNGIAACERIVYAGDLDGFGNVSYIPDGKKIHLSEAFEPHLTDDDFELAREYNDEPAILEIIGDCEGRLKAYKAIQERKASRKALGIIKRAIRMIGRSA